MSSTPWLKTYQADDPFGPMFESISELTERIKRRLEADFAEVALCMARSPTSRGRGRGMSISRSRMTRRRSGPSCGKPTRGEWLST